MNGNESLYKNTDSTEYYLGYYEPITIPYDNDTDYLILVDKKYEYKPGRLALDLYGSERLGWIFRYFNPDIINDPIFDLKSGIYIRVPTNTRLQQYI